MTKVFFHRTLDIKIPCIEMSITYPFIKNFDNKNFYAEISITETN